MSSPPSRKQRTRLERFALLLDRARRLPSAKAQAREIRVSLRCDPDMADYLVELLRDKSRQVLFSRDAHAVRREVRASLHRHGVRNVVELLWYARAGLLRGDKGARQWAALVLRMGKRERFAANALLDQRPGLLLGPRSLRAVLEELGLV